MSPIQFKLINTLRKSDQGFTLIELLVVIIIIGILSAIALPSFLNQASKAKESESKQYIGSANRAQQAYYLEKNTFSSDWTELGLGVKTSTTNYTYAIVDPGASSVVNVSYSNNTNTLRSHLGGVGIGFTNATDGEATTLAALCQQEKPGSTDTSKVAFSTAGPSCDGTTYSDLGK